MSNVGIHVKEFNDGVLRVNFTVGKGKVYSLVSGYERSKSGDEGNGVFYDYYLGNGNIINVDVKYFWGRCVAIQVARFKWDYLVDKGMEVV